MAAHTRPLRGLSLCAGGGGLDMGLHLAEPGYQTACYVEWEPYPRQAIIAAQRAGYFALAPIWDDLTTFDGRPFRGAIDTVLAGYPCQPFSAAGQRRGADDERHLWPDVARVVREIGPRWVFLENVAGHISLGLETVLRDLWDMGWTPAAGLFSAGETGAPHERQRVFIVAHRDANADSGRLDSEGIGRATGGSEEGGEQREWIRAGTRRGRKLLADTAQQRTGEPHDAQRAQPRERARPAFGRAGGGHDGAMADPNGRDSEAERQQCGGQQRFQPPGRGSGAADVDHAASARRDSAGQRAGTDQQGGQRLLGDGRSAMGHAARVGRREGWAEHGLRGRRGTASSASGAMADASSAEREGQQPGQRDAGGRQEPDGHFALSRGTGLFPPGPSDHDAWADALATAPDLAPAAGLGDCLAWASDMAQVVERQNQASAQSALCRMAYGLASRSRALRLLGNGVCPLAAGHAWRTLSAAHGLGAVDLEAPTGTDSATAATEPVLNGK